MKLCCVFWKIEAHINKYGKWHRITHLSCFEAHVSSVAIGYGTGWVWRTLTQAVLLESLSLLPEPPKCWDYRPIPPLLAFRMALKLFEKFVLGCSSILELLSAVYRAWALHSTKQWNERVNRSLSNRRPNRIKTVTVGRSNTALSLFFQWCLCVLSPPVYLHP